MLPEAEIPFVIRDGRILPLWIVPKDHRWLEVLLDRVAALDGHRREEVALALLERPELGETRNAWKAAVRLAMQLGEFETLAVCDPVEARKALFDRAARKRSLDTAVTTAEIVSEVATELGVEPRDLETSLYADLPDQRVFRVAEPLPSVGELARRLNMKIGQAILMRADSLYVQVTQQLEVVLRMARLKGLLCWAEEGEGTGAVLGVSGPLSVFRRTTIYGRALASFLPVLARTRGWRLVARCHLSGREALWIADHCEPLSAEGGLLRRFDSRVEERLFRDLARVAPELEVRREAEAVRVQGRLVVPDFVLRHRDGTKTVAVEVIGFWTPAYLENKIQVLSSVAKHAAWILCIDETLALDESRLPPWPLVRFRRRVDARALAEVVARELGVEREDG